MFSAAYCIGRMSAKETGAANSIARMQRERLARAERGSRSNSRAASKAVERMLTHIITCRKYNLPDDTL